MAGVDRAAAARALWQKPISGWGMRVRAWMSLMFADHGFLRPIYWNMDAVADKVLRGPQPNPVQIGYLARAFGIRTIINLRGATEFGSYALEREMCEKLGISLENCVLWSRDPPTREQIHLFKALIERVDYPVLLHCKSGADRAGLASALYLILREGLAVEEAARQLDGNGHLKAGPTGVLDAFFQQYRRDTASRPLDFMAWVDNVYDPAKVKAAFKPDLAGKFLVDKILRRE